MKAPTISRARWKASAQEMSTHYTGDFVKTDCGAVKPFVPPKSMQ